MYKELALPGLPLLGVLTPYTHAELHKHNHIRAASSQQTMGR